MNTFRNLLLEIQKTNHPLETTFDVHDVKFTKDTSELSIDKFKEYINQGVIKYTRDSASLSNDMLNYGKAMSSEARKMHEAFSYILSNKKFLVNKNLVVFSGLKHNIKINDDIYAAKTYTSFSSRFSIARQHALKGVNVDEHAIIAYHHNAENNNGVGLFSISSIAKQREKEQELLAPPATYKIFDIEDGGTNPKTDIPIMIYHVQSLSVHPWFRKPFKELTDDERKEIDTWRLK